MNKLLTAIALVNTPLIQSEYIPAAEDDALATLWAGNKDEQMFVTFAKIYMCAKTGDIDKADFYMDVLEAIIHDEPLPD